MKKSVFVLLVVGLIAVAILSFIIFRSREDPSPESKDESPEESQRVEIYAIPGAEVFIKSSGNKEKFLGKAPTTVEVPIAAIIILRYKDEERVFPPGTRESGIISNPFSHTDSEISFVSVSINAVPWAEVFIKPPGTNNFIEPDTQNFTRGSGRTGENRNVTPIRGKMRVQVGTSIKLVHDGREKIFPYESWGASKLISHNFLGQ